MGGSPPPLPTRSATTTATAGVCMGVCMGMGMGMGIGMGIGIIPPAAAAFALPSPRCRNLPPLPARTRPTDPDPDPNPDPGVRVFDGVFSPGAAAQLRDLARQHRARATASDGSSVFHRPPPPGVTLTALEAALDSALTALGDGGTVVEYWSRDDYINIDAHCDVDEGLLLDEGDTIRCPEWAHVAYLGVGDGVRAPTVVFPDKRGGWGSGEDEGAMGEGGGGGGGDGEGEEGEGADVRMVIVPAVEGRVLRFGGSATHAVPKPADRWLLPDVEERILREQENDGRNDDGEFWWNSFEEEDDEDDEDEDDDEDTRVVLLFNTWNTAPLYVERDPATGAMPMGIELVDDGGDQVGDAEDGASGGDEDAAAGVRCNARSAWEEVPVLRGLAEGADDDHDHDDHDDEVRICLMGNKRRRRHPKTKATLVMKSAHRSREASYEDRNPTSFVLTEK